MKKILLATILLCIQWVAYSQQIPLPTNLPVSHPRLLTTEDYKPILQKQIKEEQWATEVYDGILKRIDPYIEKTLTQPDWVYSRLMMYWKSRATQVYINGGIYSHAEGEAPAPTVRFGSTRGIYSSYKRPKLEDIVPYMDDTKGVYFHNDAKEGKPLEWVDQSNVSGGGIESINEEIIRLAKDASFVYWLTGNEKYGRFAFDIFDTYLIGMYYRTEPIDLGNGHAQTLVGLSTFEVIQERILNELAYTYDFLYSYIRQKHPERQADYIGTLKKWIDITIKNGVPQNNWNLHQAKFILKVAMVLEDNAQYSDRKGKEYYIDYILNRTSPRQWALTKFMDYGYDPQTGVWNECPGYAQGVTKDLTNFIRDYDNTFNQNLLPYTIYTKEKDGKEFSISYELEPFGSKVFYIPPHAEDTRQGEWYPKLKDPMPRPAYLPEEIVFKEGLTRTDPISGQWKSLKKGTTVDKHGVFDRHFIYYSARIPSGKEFVVSRIGDKLINKSKGDVVLALINNKLIEPVKEDQETITFRMPDNAHEVILLFENRGLHHHTNLTVEQHWLNGIKNVKVDGKEIQLKFISDEKEKGLAYSSLNFIPDSNWKPLITGQKTEPKTSALLKWYRFTFELPRQEADIWFPWHLKIAAKGNGFIYLNGHCIGRYWEEGPQEKYFLPECWLKFGEGEKNVITMSLRPTNESSFIERAIIIPDYESAEFQCNSFTIRNRYKEQFENN